MKNRILTHKIGETVFYKDNKVAGMVIGVSETYWSEGDFTSVTYVVKTLSGRVRRISGKEIDQLKKIENLQENN